MNAIETFFDDLEDLVMLGYESQREILGGHAICMLEGGTSVASFDEDCLSCLSTPHTYSKPVYLERPFKSQMFPDSKRY